MERAAGPDDRVGRWHRVALGLVVLLAAATRLHPLTRFAVWGSDSGEYLYLTERLVDTGRITFPYDGWGIAYPYFPGLFVVDGAVALFLGVDVLVVQAVLVPLLAALLPVLVYLIAREVVPDPRVGLVAAAFLAVTGPHVIVTSHAMPGTVGHLLMLLALYLVARGYRDRRWMIALPVVGVALVLTHHLTTYFLVGSVAAILMVRELLHERWDARRVEVEAPFVAFVVILASFWWLGVATPFRERIVSDVLDTNPWLFAFASLVVLAIMPPLAVVARRRFLPLPTRPPGWPGPRFTTATAAGVYACSAAGIALLLLVPVPGTNIQVVPLTLVYVLPVLVFLAFTVAGVRVLQVTPRGTFVTGWLAAIVASLVFAAVTSQRVLFPFRHVEYLMEPVAILAGAGIVAAVDHWTARRPGVVARRVATAAVVLAVVAGAAASQPPRETVGGFEEGISATEYSAITWAAEGLPADAVVAADHRTSSLLWGIAHANATWDFAYHTYHAGTVEGALPELRCVQTNVDPCARVTHVLLSPEIREGVTLVQWEPSAPMSDAAQAKFEDARFFTPVYGDPADRNAASIVRVEWGALEVAYGPFGEA